MLALTAHTEWTPTSSSLLVNSSLVNCIVWSELNISGFTVLWNTFSTRRMQKSLSSVGDNPQDIAQSIKPDLNCWRVNKALGKPNFGYINRTDLIRASYWQPSQQIDVFPMCRMRIRCVRLQNHRNKPNVLHQCSVLFTPLSDNHETLKDVETAFVYRKRDSE